MPGKNKINKHKIRIQSKSNPMTSWKKILFLHSRIISLNLFLANNNAKNSIEKWTKNVKYKWLLNLLFKIVSSFKMTILVIEMINIKKNKSDRSTEMFDYISRKDK